MDDEWNGLSAYPIVFTTQNPITRGSVIERSTSPSTYDLRLVAYWKEAKHNAKIIKPFINPITLKYKSTDNKKHIWSDDNTYYWPLVGCVSFYCYGPYKETDTSTTLLWSIKSTNDNPYLELKVPSEVSSQYDLLTCKGNTNVTSSDKVEFTLRHALSRIGISIVNSTGSSITDLSVSFSGEFFTYGKWNLQDFDSWSDKKIEHVTYTPELKDNNLADNGTTQNKDDNYLMVIPTQGDNTEYIDISITVSFKIGGKAYVATNTQKEQNLKIETATRYSITLTTASIQEVTTSASAPATRAVAPLEVTTCVEPWE
jgi:hypothetical protein